QIYTLSLHDALPILIFLHTRSIDDKIGMDFHLAAVIFLHSDIRNQVARARRRHFRPSRLRIEPLDPDSQSFLGVIEIVALAGFRSEEHTSELQSRFD